jgi:urate oxidase
MSALLSESSYGKSQVRLTKVTRHAGVHDLKELCVAIQLEGDFAASYTHGDNSRIVPTDTMKNTIYALARNHPLTDIESFGLTLASHFIENFAHVSSSTIRLAEEPWQRILVNGQEHPHAFIGGGNAKRTSTVTMTRQSIRIESGIDDLVLLKTADSAFTGFLRDAYTTLPETADRIFATRLTGSWLYKEGFVDWNRAHELIRRTLLENFARHKSLAVQQTLHTMASAALESCSDMQRITLAIPNKHHLLVDLQPFGLDNPNMIFVPTDEPYGLITATLQRG